MEYKDYYKTLGVDLKAGQKEIKKAYRKLARNGRIFRLQKMGMPEMKNPDQRGNLYVTVETILPKHLTAGEKKLVEQWKAVRSDNGHI